MNRLNIAMIGYGFMGRAHSNAWRQVRSFFDIPYEGSVAFNLERMNELEFYSDKGPNSGFKTIQATDPTHPYVKGWWPPGHIIGYEHTFTHTVLELLQALTEKRPPLPDFEDGVKNQQVLDAVERSAATGTWQSLT